jgi:hypothetical protein
MSEDEFQAGGGEIQSSRDAGRPTAADDAVGRSGREPEPSLEGYVRRTDDGEYAFDVGAGGGRTTRAEGSVPFEFVYDGAEETATLTVDGVTTTSHDVGFPTAGTLELAASAAYATDGGPGSVDVADIRVNGESLDPGVLSASVYLRERRRVESLHVEGLDPFDRTTLSGTLSIDAPSESEASAHQIVVEVR